MKRVIAERGAAPLPKETMRARSAGGSADACFSKRFSEEWLFRATLHNSLRAWAASRRSQWLRVPRVLDADRRDLRIDYERLDGWYPVRTVLRDRAFERLTDDALERMFWTIGAALEEFHRHTRRIHGDFDFDNILVKRGADKAAFVDFTPPVYACFRDYNRADPYRDIATLILVIRAKYPPHRIYLALRSRLRALALAVIEGYFRADPSRYDPAALARSIDEILDGTYLGESFAGRYLRRTRLFRIDDLVPGT